MPILSIKFRFQPAKKFVLKTSFADITMAKEHKEKKEKKEKKDVDGKKEKKSKRLREVSATHLAEALNDPTNTSTDIVLTDANKSRDSIDPLDEDLYESRLPAQAPFAKPLANKKLNKKLLKTIKKGILLDRKVLTFSLPSKAIEERSQRSHQIFTKRRKRVSLPVTHFLLN